MNACDLLVELFQFNGETLPENQGYFNVFQTFIMYLNRIISAQVLDVLSDSLLYADRALMLWAWARDLITFTTGIQTVNKC